MHEFRCSYVVTVLLAMLWLGFFAVPLTFLTFFAEMICWAKYGGVAIACITFRLTA